MKPWINRKHGTIQCMNCTIVIQYAIALFASHKILNENGSERLSNVLQIISIWLPSLKSITQSLWLYTKGQTLCRKYSYNGTTFSKGFGPLVGFPLSDRCLLSLEQVPIHFLPTGALVPADCQVCNENSVAWEDMSFSRRWWKVTSTPFPGRMSYFPATFSAAH